MKKLVSVLLVLAMVFGLVACSASGSDTTATTPAKDTKTETATSSDATAPASTDAAAEETVAGPSGQIVYGVTSTMAGDLGFTQWSSIGGDKPIMALIDAYAPACYDQDAKWIWDNTVVKEHSDKDNEDGSITYTITINDNLYFSNGAQITAKNYVAYPLTFASPAAVSVDGYGTAGKEFVGQAEYKAGEAATISGVRLIDDYTFEITIAAKYNPYYYGLSILNFFPIDYTMWLGEATADVADDGEGAHFVTAKEFNGENYGAAISNARTIYTDRVCSGPYYLESLDVAASEAVLRANPYYNGNFDGQKAGIETIIIKAVSKATMLDQLKNGEVDIIDGIGDGASINACLDLAETGDFGATNYKYSGYMKNFYQCDWGPTQFVAVRKALTYLTDRESITMESTLGFGNVTNGQYSFAQWMALEMEEELSSELEAYAYNPDKAVALLVEDGWTLNADGSEYVAGSGAVRYKKVTAEQAAFNGVDNVDGIMPGCIAYEDGYLMPLHLKYLGHAEGEGIETTLDELLTIYLVESDVAKNAGVEFDKTVMSDSDLCAYLNRRNSNGDADASKYQVQSYNLMSLASGLGAAKFDKSGSWSLTDPATNKNRFYEDDGVLDKLSMDMIYGVRAGDDATYQETWFNYQKEYNAYLPEMPLYNWTYCAVYNAKLQGFTETNIWSFQYAILYCTVA